MTDLSKWGGGIDHGRHVSLVDLARMVHVAGIEDPDLPTPLLAWREFEDEIAERIWRTTLYAARRACPDAPPAPSAYPPDNDLVSDLKRRRRELNKRAGEQATFGGEFA